MYRVPVLAQVQRHDHKEVKHTVKLKEARVRAGLGKLKLSKLAGVDRPLLYRYEAGLRKPGIKNAIKLARVLGVELADVDEFRPALEEAVEIGLVVGGDKVA